MKYATNQSESRTTVSVNRSSNHGRTILHHHGIRRYTRQWKEAGFLSWMKKMAKEMPWFALLQGTVDDFIDDQENKNTRAKTNRDIILLKTFLQTKGESKNVEEIPPANLDDFLSEFILTVRTKEGKTISLHLSEGEKFFL